MLRTLPYLAGALLSASAFAGGYLDPVAGTARETADFNARWSAIGEPSVRQDRLALPPRLESKPITTVERLDTGTVAIVYRDRSGRVLFQNDPATGTTTVMKGVVVPDVAVRRTAPRPAVRPWRDVEREDEKKLLDACEGAFSAVAAPSLAHIPGRCMA